ncbi:helix-turn-helix domain-containing protein [Streptomyces sp. TRM68416]|uniref:helix-turn-helix domain-containing protein n=1 Tax=Streptomyces sp. TRM68416 TaxID=2758412 RepID=UPI001661B483|nr:helix-turn-helix transcriptional regulator [Streptomyces sp. TRM68416]MBD0837404.1 helix-turn-helix transcriptional regulator [Streptomyces sp. TRM68416]
MPEPHERLDEAMNQRRLELRLNWRDVAKGAGISYEALRAIRRGDSKPTELTARALDEILRWMPGSVYAVLNGGMPTTVEAWEAEHESPSAEAISPSEALRRMVRASAKELGMKPDDVNEAMRLVRQDLDAERPFESEQPSPNAGSTPRARSRRTDLSDLVRLGRAEAGLSLEAVAAATVDAKGERLVEADWLDRLERAALAPDEHPEYPQLDALVAVLHLDPNQAQEAAGVQFTDVHTVWSGDGQVRGLMEGDPSAEDAAKMQELMRLYRKSPQRRDG